MNRRQFVFRTLCGLAGSAFLRHAGLALAQAPKAANAATVEKVDKIEKIVRTEDEWAKLLTPVQFAVLRQEGTERAFTSPLNNEKRKGTFVCAGCDLPLFESKTKYDSGTGWPSFYAAISDRVETKIDHKMILPRNEYHCVRCGGHQGHVFDDGPKPTGLRYCNNGVALKFVPA